MVECVETAFGRWTAVRNVLGSRLLLFVVHVWLAARGLNVPAFLGILEQAFPAFGSDAWMYVFHDNAKCSTKWYDQDMGPLVSTQCSSESLMCYKVGLIPCCMHRLFCKFLHRIADFKDET